MNPFITLPLLPVFLALFTGLAMAEKSPAPAAPETGLEGVITMSPTHGGAIRQGEPETKPLARMAFVVKQEERTVASFETDEQGHFRIALPPGHYNVLAADQRYKFGNYGPFPTDVVAGKVTQVRWDCDSGMR